MPEAPIDEDGYARTKESKVGRYVSDFRMLPVTETGSPEMMAQS